MSKWLVDYDSTLVNLHQAQFDLIERELGERYTYDVITTWDWYEWMPNPAASDLAWGDQGFKNLTFQAELPEVPEAVETCQELITLGEELVVVSDRPDVLYDVTRDWLDRHGLGAMRLIFTDRKTYPKTQCALAEGLTNVVEDAPHHAEAFKTCANIDTLYLLDYGYNRIVEQGPTIVRVPSWRWVLIDHIAGLSTLRKGAA